MTPTMIEHTPPSGFRFMLSHEAERLSHGQPVYLLVNGDLARATVKSFGDATMTVELRSGHLATLDLDDPDFWGEDEVRSRRPPMTAEGDIVALWEVIATADEDVEPLLKVGVALAIAAKDDVELQNAIAALRRIITDRIRGRVAA